MGNYKDIDLYYSSMLRCIYILDILFSLMFFFYYFCFVCISSNSKTGGKVSQNQKPQKKTSLLHKNVISGQDMEPFCRAEIVSFCSFSTHTFYIYVINVTVILFLL